MKIKKMRFFSVLCLMAWGSLGFASSLDLQLQGTVAAIKSQSVAQHLTDASQVAMLKKIEPSVQANSPGRVVFVYFQADFTKASGGTECAVVVSLIPSGRVPKTLAQEKNYELSEGFYITDSFNQCPLKTSP